MSTRLPAEAFAAPAQGRASLLSTASTPWGIAASAANAVASEESGAIGEIRWSHTAAAGASIARLFPFGNWMSTLLQSFKG
eukprot:scaffold199270_cov31-Tisochrysis_lutea.AAC.1